MVSAGHVPPETLNSLLNAAQPPVSSPNRLPDLTRPSNDRVPPDPACRRNERRPITGRPSNACLAATLTRGATATLRPTGCPAGNCCKRMMYSQLPRFPVALDRLPPDGSRAARPGAFTAPLHVFRGRSPVLPTDVGGGCPRPVCQAARMSRTEISPMFDPERAIVRGSPAPVNHNWSALRSARLTPASCSSAPRSAPGCSRRPPAKRTRPNVPTSTATVMWTWRISPPCPAAFPRESVGVSDALGGRRADPMPVAYQSPISRHPLTPPAQQRS